MDISHTRWACQRVPIAEAWGGAALVTPLPLIAVQWVAGIPSVAEELLAVCVCGWKGGGGSGGLPIYPLRLYAMSRLVVRSVC